MIKKLIVVLSLLISISLVFAVGFHTPSEIISGNFSGDFNFLNGNIGIGSSPQGNSKTYIQNDNTAADIIGLYIYNDEISNWGLLIQGSSPYGIFLGTNADNTCADQGATGVCDINSDYAELMYFSEEIDNGEVVVIDVNNEGKFKKSTKAYDKLVAGVVSTNPAMVIGPEGTKIKGWDSNSTNAYPLAVAGKKRIKVSNENGEIEIGDFLVTSSTPGYAMRCDEYQKCQGAILAKAMSKIGNDEKVLALITLQ